LSLRFAEEEAVLTLSPRQQFLMNDKQGQIACLTMMPGHRTIIIAFQLVGRCFIYDVNESKLFFAPELGFQDTTEVD
jgi:hypothetical protein